MLDELKELAWNSPAKKQKMAAIVTDKRGRILASSTNLPKSHPVQAKYAHKAKEPHRIWLHAEIASIIRCRSSEAHSLYVGRLNKKGSLALAKPCQICTAAILESPIEDVYYTDNNGLLIHEKAEDL